MTFVREEDVLRKRDVWCRLVNTVGPGCNDNGFYDTPSIASGVPGYEFLTVNHKIIIF